MKNLILLAACVQMISAQVKLSVGNVSVVQGSNGAAVVTVDSGGLNPVALQFTLTYSPDIYNLIFSPGVAAASSAKTISCGLKTSTSTTCMVSGINQTVINNGPLALVSFTAASSPSSHAVPMGMVNVTSVAATNSIPSLGISGVVTLTGNPSWVEEGVNTPGHPSFNGYQRDRWDPVAGMLLHYGHGHTISSGIYSSALAWFDPSKNSWTTPPSLDTGTTTDSCPLDSATMPGDRHPMGQFSVDTNRGVLWLHGGLNEACSASAPDPGNRTPRQDAYYLVLHPDPSLDTWHRIFPAHFPKNNLVASCVYDSDDDATVCLGYDGGASVDDTWRYCSTMPVGGGTPTGVLSVLQTAGGCSVPDDWTNDCPVAIAGGGKQLAGHCTVVTTHPPGTQYPGLEYDPSTKQVIAYGGKDGGGYFHNETWAYSVPNKQWVKKCLACSVVPPIMSSTGSGAAFPMFAYNSLSAKLFFHQFNGVNPPSDWMYDPAVDAWSQMTPTGGGWVGHTTTSGNGMVYDPLHMLLITDGLGTAAGVSGLDIWEGAVQ